MQTCKIVRVAELQWIGQLLFSAKVLKYKLFLSKCSNIHTLTIITMPVRMDNLPQNREMIHLVAWLVTR
jgi:hypothetical protein